MRLWLLVACSSAFVVAGCDSPNPSRDGAASTQVQTPSPAKGNTNHLEQVKRVVAGQFKVNADEINVDRPLLDYGDELNVIEVIMTLEEKYLIKIPDERFMDKTAVGSLGIHKDLSTTKLARIVQELLSR